MKKIALLLLATLFALVFIYGFMPGLSAKLSKQLLWIGQIGLMICLSVIFLIRKKKD
jgi:hypothetical protein